MLFLTLLACDSGPDYGPLTSTIRPLERDLEADPCNRSALVEVAGLLEKANATPTAQDKVAAFRKACKSDKKIEELDYDLSIKTQRWDNAVAIAQSWVEGDPKDPTLRLKLADTYAKKGDAAGELAALHQAVLLQRKDLDAKVRLAKAQEAAGKPCDAWETWGLIWNYHEDQRTQAIAERTRLGCADRVATGEGKATHTATKDGYFTVPASVGGQSGNFAMASSSPLTTISAALAQKAGIKGGGSDVISDTMSGMVTGQIATVTDLEVAGVKVGPIEVLIVEMQPEGVDGVLGLNWLLRASANRPDPNGSTWVFAPQTLSDKPAAADGK